MQRQPTTLCSTPSSVAIDIVDAVLDTLAQSLIAAEPFLDARIKTMMA